MSGWSKGVGRDYHCPTDFAIVDSVAHLSIVQAESFALNEVSEVEKQRVGKHVASCQRCADLLGEKLFGWPRCGLRSGGKWRG